MEVTPASLDLHDEDDRYQLRVDIELLFQFKLTDIQAVSVKTVGDIYNIILCSPNFTKEGSQRCSTSMAFYRLRSELGQASVRSSVKPCTFLRGVKFNRYEIKRKLMKQYGLKLPPVKANVSKKRILMLILLLTVIFIYLTIISDYRAIYTPIFISPLFFWRKLASKVFFLSEDETMRELSNEIVLLNIGHFAQSGAKISQSEVWNALTKLLARSSLVPERFQTPDMGIS